jgi:RHS-like element (fragment)
MEFEILNNPQLLRNGSKVSPAFNQIGKGAEFMTKDPVKVRLINVQPLRK